MNAELAKRMRAAFDESMRATYGHIDDREKTAWNCAAVVASSYTSRENAKLLKDKRRLQRERAKLRDALREAITIVEKYGGHIVGEDMKALAARGTR